jgi:hypothetical protein
MPVVRRREIRLGLGGFFLGWEAKRLLRSLASALHSNPYQGEKKNADSIGYKPEKGFTIGHGLILSTAMPTTSKIELTTKA